jgi:hypothetical protein
VPVTTGGNGEKFSPEISDRALGICKIVMENFLTNATDQLTHFLRDARILRRLLEAVKGILTRADTQWKLGTRDD